jgi:hypothetical protein
LIYTYPQSQRLITTQRYLSWSAHAITAFGPTAVLTHARIGGRGGNRLGGRLNNFLRGRFYGCLLLRSHLRPDCHPHPRLGQRLRDRYGLVPCPHGRVIFMAAVVFVAVLAAGFVFVILIHRCLIDPMVKVKVVQVVSKVKDINLRRHEPETNEEIANLYALSKYILVIADHRRGISHVHCRLRLGL